MLTSMRKFFRGKGQGIVEYALLLAFVVALAVFALSDSNGVGSAVKQNFSETANKITNFSTKTN